MALVLETLGSHQALDLGGLGVFGLALLGEGAADNELADIILLLEAEEGADLGGALRSETLGHDGVGETRELTLALLDDAEGHDSEIESGDGCSSYQSCGVGDEAYSSRTTTDTLALALTSAAGAVAARSPSVSCPVVPVMSRVDLPVAVAQEQSGTGGEEN